MARQHISTGEAKASRRRVVGLAAAASVAVAALWRHRPDGLSAFVGLPRQAASVSPATTSQEKQGRSLRTVMYDSSYRATSDPVTGVTPEISAAGKYWAQRYEDMFLTGTYLWKNLKKMNKNEPPRLYFIGMNGNRGEEIAESLCECLGYTPAADGTYFIHRRPDQGHPPIRYTLSQTDKLLAEKAGRAPTDLYMEDEEKYRDIESQVLKEFSEMKTNYSDYPMGIIVGEGAVLRQENIDIMKKGVVIWLDVDPLLSWQNTQYTPEPTGGIYVPPEFFERPPVWAIANGWDGDVDDAEGKAEYVKIVNSRRELYEQVADVRLRTDVPEVAGNSYWGAERIVKALNRHFNFKDEDVSLEQETLERDLGKFLEGARLQKYQEQALAWCTEQGAATIEDVVENADDFAEALSLKPLEKKRLQKAAAAILVSAT
eukprot:TRINITY_DN100544_c0_g1_i1.p2 TRINITY_DN100544_c0_g1~~TRINITY_DN100544_c0_g1_i1.p2  ORF type:complete len:430 (+),score=134.64 TRINITY_DN100544_c0_g1_i1:73-1362(+)